MITFNTQLVARYYEADDELYGPAIEAAAKASALTRKAEAAADKDRQAARAATDARQAVSDRVQQLISAGDDPDGHPDVKRLQQAVEKAERAAQARKDASPAYQLRQAAQIARLGLEAPPGGFDAVAAMARHIHELDEDSAALEAAYQALGAATARVADRLDLLAGACAAHPDKVTSVDLAEQARVQSAVLTMKRVMSTEGRPVSLPWTEHLDDAGVYHAPQMQGLPPVKAFANLKDIDPDLYANERPDRRGRRQRARSEVVS